MPSLFSWIAATVLCGGLAFGVWYAIQPEAPSIQGSATQALPEAPSTGSPQGARQSSVVTPSPIPGHSTLTAGGQAVSLSQNQILQSP